MAVIVKSFVRFAFANTTMLSKNDIKLIRSLQQGKYRRKHHCFVAEGNKVINELLDAGFTFKKIFTLDPSLFSDSESIIGIKEKELKQISFLNHPKDSLGIFNLPDIPRVDAIHFTKTLNIVCEGVQDPGNIGTIVRIADWFGFSHVICSEDTADIFNPKVVQSSMGSIARVKVIYTDVSAFLHAQKGKLPIMVATLSGQNIHNTEFPSSGFLVMGNESKGISPELIALADHNYFIPGSGQAESLNVAVSTGILCSELKRPR